MISVSTCPLIIRSFLHSYIDSSDETSIDPSKLSSPYSAIECFFFKFPYPLLFLMSSSSCLLPLLLLLLLLFLLLLLLLHLSTNSILSSIFPSIPCFKDISYANCDQSGQSSLFLLYVDYYYYYYIQAMKIHNS